MEAYCVKCKENREVLEPNAEFNALGTPVTRGKCSVCGTTMYRIGATPDHEGLEKPPRRHSRPRCKCSAP